MEKIYIKIVTKSIGFYINLLSFVSPKKALKIAYKFFSEPRVGKLNQDKLPTLLQQAALEIIHFEDYQFPIYKWKGNEQIILLVHGWESNTSRWEQLLPYLKETGYSIIAIDAPAHGLATGKEFNVPDYASFLHIVAQKFKPEVLIGHSIGGAACLFYQDKYKNEAISKMIVMGAPSDLRVLLDNYVALLSLNKKVVQLIEDFFWKRFQIKVEDFSGRNFGARLQIPGIIAHDRNDTVVSYDEALKIAEGWKNARLISTNHLDHSMHDDNLYKEIQNFIKQKT